MSFHLHPALPVHPFGGGQPLRPWQLTLDSPESGGPARARGLILDLDDTLYPREHFMVSGFAAVARHVEEHHRVPSGAALATIARARDGGRGGRELQTLCEEHGLPPSVVLECLRIFRSHRPSITLPRGVASVLLRLRAERWRMVVLTNGMPSVQRAKVAALGLASLVDGVIYAEELVPGGKPSREVFAEALRRLDLVPDRCLCVGDDPVRDIGGARAIGLRAVRIARPGDTVDPETDADAVIYAFDDLPMTAAALLQMGTVDVA